MSTQPPSRPGLFQSLVPVLFLIVLLSFAVYFFGEDASYGPNQIALILSAAVGVLLGIRSGYTWKELEEGIVKGISLASGAILILLVVGSLIGTWILSGIVPALIYWGLQILDPTFFFVSACAICALISFVTGSSWTTVSTIGIALVGVAVALDLSLPVVAGAIVSGAYFGDKLSPLSDTTNLAPAMAGTELFAHIRHMLWTTVPTISISLVIFTILGLRAETGVTGEGLQEVVATLSSSFDIGPHLLIPPGIVLLLVMRKTPAFPALLIGALLGGVFACLFQQRVVLQFVDQPELGSLLGLLKGSWTALFAGYTCSTGNAQIDELLTRGGMRSMLDTVWLILSAMVFGGVMEKTGNASGNRREHSVAGAKYRLSRLRDTRHLHRNEHHRFRSVRFHCGSRPNVPRRVSKTGIESQEPVPLSRGRRHPDFATGALEHLWSLHGTDSVCGNLFLLALLFLQPDESGCLGNLWIHRFHDRTHRRHR